MDDVVKLGTDLRWYGDGIVSILLDNDEMYNFYGGRFYDGDVHNHHGDMHSTVIQGKLRNNIFTFEPKDDGQYSQYRGKCVNNCEAASNFCCQFDLVEPAVELTRIMYFDSQPGDTYWLEYHQIHNIQLLTENVITHLQFGPKMQSAPLALRPRADVGTACVLGKGSTMGDGISSISPSDEEMWDIIERVVKNI